MFTRKGQSTLEYALIIAVVVAGLLLMQHYVRRGYAGRLKSASDDLGEQYDPTAYTGTFAVSQSSRVTTTVQDRVSNQYHAAPQTSTRTGSETVDGWAVNAASSTLFDR
jgi:hypothetical protein